MSCIEAATWTGAIATFIAVIVALFKEDIVKFWRCPNLDLRVKLEAPDCQKIPLQVINQSAGKKFRIDSYYLRLWIFNSGRVRVDRVQVFASKLLRQHADSEFKKEQSFLPMNLKWSHSQLSSKGPEIFAEGISPDMGKHCDLGHIKKAETTKLELDLEVLPNTGSHILTPGKYRLDIKIAAGNFKPITRTIEINLTGAWFDDEARMFSDGLGLKVIK